MPDDCEQQQQEDHRSQQQPAERSARANPTSSTRRAGHFRCVGAIRKCGFLWVKKWILRRRQCIELARKQGWKRYWVCLRGTSLLFHSLLEGRAGAQSAECVNLADWLAANRAPRLEADRGGAAAIEEEDEEEEEKRAQLALVFIERQPRHLIIIEGAIAQPIPEHPRRDFVFCLSTSFGDAYLFQAQSQRQSDAWICAAHNACSASIARDSTRDEAIRLFEGQIRQLELEADKKLFLRQRLESRLTSMSSICHLTSADQQPAEQEAREPPSMRTLLHRLSQQMLALDNFIEQLHCQVYQLRCYWSSCVHQRNLLATATSAGGPASAHLSLELPHPRSLLMHVSKPTKLLLIRLGVFTVSSLHAYLHARQGSADQLLRQIQQAPANQPAALELGRSQSSWALSFTQNELDQDTERLIELADLREVQVRVARALYQTIRRSGERERPELADQQGDFLLLRLQVKPSTSALTLVKLALETIEPDLPELEFLQYYLRARSAGEPSKSEAEANSAHDGHRPSLQFVAKRRETLADWANLEQLQLERKVLFRLQLTRSRVDEESAPFGLALAAQLFATSAYQSQLNVFASYVEWGSSADRMGLSDDDELLEINGVRVGELDMMFVECIIADQTRLALLVRSSRSDYPQAAQACELSASRTSGPDKPEDPSAGADGMSANNSRQANAADQANPSSSNQLISDEYISSLVCPPPPSQSGAFLAANSSLLRPKVHLQAPNSPEPPGPPSSLADTELPTASGADNVHLAAQLLQKTEQLTQMIGAKHEHSNCEAANSLAGAHQRANALERLRKSLTELLETEYAYVKHLELINDNYMQPLANLAHLRIVELQQLNTALVRLVKFQTRFFARLTESISACCNQPAKRDHCDQIHLIVQQLDANQSEDEFRAILFALANTFAHEAENFKIYAAYCAAYTKFQRFLHPKRVNMLTCTPPAWQASSLETFVSSASLAASSNSSAALASSSAHKELVKASNLFEEINNNSHDNNNEDLGARVGRLNEFLANLDSSSSSVSLSLAKSSASERTNGKPVARGAAKSVAQQNFESHLIKPIQRIVKYPMLLSSIAVSARTDSDAGELRETLVGSLKAMESIASHVNDAQRIYDELALVLYNIERLYVDQQTPSEATKSCSPSPLGAHQPPISLDIAQLLYFGPVEWLNVTEFTPKLKKGMSLSQLLLVFSSCVVFICKDTMRLARKRLSCANGESGELIIRYQTLIPVSEVQVRSVASSSSSHSPADNYKWELFHCSSVNSNSSLLTKSSRRKTGGKVYLLSSSCNETRNAFLRKIRFIIRESVRNMSLPMPRSPSSKSLTPKKLSSPSTGTNTNSSCSHSTSLSPVCHSQEHCDGIKDEVECTFASKVESNFAPGIQVNN